MVSSVKRVACVGIYAVCVSFGLSVASLAEADTSVRNPDWAQPIAPDQNLFQVTPDFYRSARLLPESVPKLQALGIKTVVSLRAFHSDEALLKQSGIRMVRIPIYTWDIDDKDVIAALRAVHEAQSQGPVLLHCLHGADRTGLISAMYRIVYQGWSREQALDELEHGGYGYHAIWKNIPNYLRHVDIEQIKRSLQISESASK